MPARFDADSLDDGIRASVLLLRGAGFNTFTSCEGGRGHSFADPTIGIELEGDYFRFRDRLAAFLNSHGIDVFLIKLITYYDYRRPAATNHVFLESLDLLSPAKYKRAIASIKRRERRILCEVQDQEADRGRLIGRFPRSSL